MLTVQFIKEAIEKINEDLRINNLAHISYLNAQELEAHDESYMLTFHINFKPYGYLNDEDWDENYAIFLGKLQELFSELSLYVYNALQKDSQYTVEAKETQTLDLVQYNFYRDLKGCYTQVLGDESIMISFMQIPS